MNILYYDLETEGKPDLCEEFPQPFRPGRLTDKAKIAAAFAKHKAKQKSEAALHPQTARILTIQYAVNDGEVRIIHSESERAMLVEWWKTAAYDVDKLVNWTGSNKGGNFDKNFLYRRSWAHNLTLPYIEPRLWQDAARAFLADAEWGSYYKLETAAKEMGIPVQETETTGKTFAKMWRDPNTIEDATVYATQDVLIVRELWERMR